MRFPLLVVGLLVLVLTEATSAQTGNVSRYTLPNGLRLLVREDSSAGVVAVSLQSRAGSRFETPETAGITNFLQRTTVRGTAHFTGTRLADAAERLGGNIDASGDIDFAEISARALARNWEALLGLVAEVALTPTLPAAEVDRERRLILSQIQTRGDNPFPLAFDTLLTDLYGPHPYALPNLGHRAVVERLTREELLAHYHALYRADRLVLAVSGRVEHDRVRRAAERLFAKLPGGGTPSTDPAVAPVPSAQRRVMERAAQQAQVLVGYLGPGVGDADYAAVKVMSALLGGGMSGRFFTELRDVQGLAYSLGVMNPARIGPAPIVAYLGTVRASAAAAEAGVIQQLERIRTEGATDDEVARARAYQLGVLAMDRRTNARHAWYLAFYEQAGVGWDFPDRYARALAAVTAADVTAVARRYLVRPTSVILLPRE
ncbi:MAG: hypothetical protein AUG14_13470 [Candidatus Rokubacteria bacterium 13_1_20CM_2_68_19]|nr:MAG: hypothetical protein AUH18_10780 [Candidatus Rokubacteria bacterium 13_2_20CM_69_10]OLB39957.1 MAG: hypothetical protein AUI04_10775 [Candidatus Rokubacteria bacterium 13_2_20CM_2_64_8]OLC62418.1 MAG: hypothetical protein AUH76_08405 [Candidatus Rokubacteria bacterium 13_1_40CM_4_67_11]OLD32538.1 MAG: hypothetical protein AUI49_02800 [Candidatus Rokubacteria bacterium 13_1_40CM_2_68_13]OLE42021.1 MAG: hypothetical protein AUG14_13470 [Candidatus Rokubacteria bacterium 13_1_20CM_2_68_19]